MKKIVFAVLAIIAVLGMVACSDSRGWTLNGKVDGSEGGKVALEKFVSGIWVVEDSIEIAGDGSFKYTAAAPASYPDVMRVSFGGKSIYFPVDSINDISINTTAADFGVKYLLEGSKQATTMYSIDSLLNAVVSTFGVDAVRSNRGLKNKLFGKAFEDSTVVCLYYLINKTVGNKPLFDLSKAGDLRLYGAVAQRFATQRPNDPRTKYLTDRYTTALASNSGVTTEIVLDETALIDIMRRDVNGQMHSLKDLASKGKVVLLNFTAYGLETSPAYNILLNDLWTKYHDKGLEIYQIAFDHDESFWMSVARNLPWTAVWNTTTSGDEALRHYNVGAMPMSYIINRKGELVTRVIEPSVLESEVKKNL